eukprot:scaffold27425_cov69-Phaeocystis_antarctica.AAC.8
MSRHTVPVGKWMKVQGKFKMQAHPRSGVVMDIAAFKVSHSSKYDSDTTTLRAARARSSSIGALEELSGKVQNASTHRLPCRHHEHTHNSRSVGHSVQGGAGYKFKECSRASTPNQPD